MVIPINISLERWAASLIVDFPEENIPFLYNNQEWKRWGDTLVLNESFASNGAPSPHLYDDWRIWAQEVFKTMANF